jgi:hypothetical protein
LPRQVELRGDEEQVALVADAVGRGVLSDSWRLQQQLRQAR